MLFNLSIATQVAQEIEAETKVQNDIISDLVSLFLGFGHGVRGRQPH